MLSRMISLSYHPIPQSFWVLVELKIHKLRACHYILLFLHLSQQCMFQGDSFNIVREQKLTKETSLGILCKFSLWSALTKDNRRSKRISPIHMNNLVTKVLHWSLKASSKLCVSLSPPESLPCAFNPTRTQSRLLEEKKGFENVSCWSVTTPK
jgi:hypothetical protein